jgi:hypothetical protein
VELAVRHELRADMMTLLSVLLAVVLLDVVEMVAEVAVPCHLFQSELFLVSLLLRRKARPLQMTMRNLSL